jgi:hypothetical protein
MALTTSPNEISQDYQKIFNRAPDAQGEQYWENSGLSGQSLIDALISGAQGNDVQSAQNYLAQQKSNANANPYGVQNASSLMKTMGSSTDPYTQAAQATSLGNLGGAQAATAANRVNQITPFGSLQYQQTGVDAQGNPIWSASQTMSPELQNIYGNLSQTAQNTYSQAFNPTLPSYGINPGQTYSDAIMQRLQPTQQAQQKSFDAQMANQGIVPGTEAYNNAYRNFSQAQNDQLTSAIVGGMNTGLAANQQAYNQALNNYQLPLNTLGAVKNLINPNTTYVSPYNQASVTGPDYLTAYNQAQQNQIAANAAQQSGQNAVTSGLFGLGSSLIGSKAGSNLISSGLSSLGSLFGF